jgi:DNA polymerase III epsilon subunit-like protein
MGVLRRLFAKARDTDYPSTVQPRPGMTPPPRQTAGPRSSFQQRASRSRVPLHTFTPGYLSRHARGARAKDLTFAALDIETTGLETPKHRVYEIGIVRFRGDGSIIDEYTTLIDPQRRISPVASEINNISDEDVNGAPKFHEVCADILQMLEGSIVVSHNLLFEDQFLSAELARIRQSAPELVGLCSLVTWRAQLDGPSYKLQSIYRTVTGEWVTSGSSALGGSRAISEIVPWLIMNSPSELYYVGNLPKPAANVSAPTPMARIFPRAERLTRRADGYLGALAKRFPRTSRNCDVPESAKREYAMTLDEILRDHRITGQEGWRMEYLARHAGFNQQQLIAAHKSAWERAVKDLPLSNPELLTMAQRRKLAGLAHDVGYPELAEGIAPPNDVQLDTAATYIRGWRVGVDGDDEASATLKKIIEENGGSVAKRLTSTVRFVAAKETSSETPQLIKAREIGLPIITIKEASRELHKAINSAKTEHERRQREEEEWQAERARRRADDEAYFRHNWRPNEQDPLWSWGEKIVTVSLQS